MNLVSVKLPCVANFWRIPVMLDCFCWEMYVPVKWIELILHPGRTLLQNLTTCVLWLFCWLDISEVKKLCLKLRTQLDFCLSISNTSDILLSWVNVVNEWSLYFLQSVLSGKIATCSCSLGLILLLLLFVCLMENEKTWFSRHMMMNILS